jgi:hypothetical protein
MQFQNDLLQTNSFFPSGQVALLRSTLGFVSCGV